MAPETLRATAIATTVDSAAVVPENSGSPGGGGGYSGGGAAGDWSSFSTYGGGGGSYNIGTDQDNEGGVREGDGLIVITLGEVLTPCIGGCMIPEAYNYNPDADYDDGSCTLLDCPEYDGDVVVEFQKDNYADFNQPENQDQVTPTCVITRQNAQGLFNIALEGNHNQSSSPANTEWKWGDINSPYPYDNWRDAVYQSPFGGPNSALSQGSNSVMTMHVIDSDLYFEVQFDQWTGNGQGGGFEYTRTFLPEESGCDEYLAVVGCMDPLAQNYNMEAELDDSSCIYPGCTDPVADNYDPQANEDDGSCAYNLGCLDQEACNYDDTAEIDDGSCAYEFDCAGVCGGASYIDSCGDCIDANMASGQVTFEYSGQIDTWTVPEGVTAVRIEARGAQGGGNGGRGAIMAGTVDVTPGDVLNILVGQEGETAPNQVGNGGGGGTFVALADNTPLVVAGGGGGTGHNQSNNGYSGIGGAITEAGNAGQYANDNGGGAGGTDGNGGEYSTNGNGGPIGNAGGGGGFFTDGTSFQDANGGQAFVNGGLGGDSTGGFGGGAGSNQFNYGCGSSPMGGGGGGGYSGGGGGGTNCNGAGGGGGSFNAGSDQENQPAANSGDGLVIITYGLEVAQAACTGGCTLPEAYNYDPEADYDDGSCTVLECDEYQGAPVVTFTKADYADFNDPANQDEITPTCIITRQNQQGIYNVAFEQSHNQNLSPLNTTWKWGDFDSPNTWDNWRDAVYQSGIGGPNNAFDIPHTMTMRITDSDLYFEFVFEAWTSNGQGGGFTYTRTFLVEESGCQEVTAVAGCMDNTACNYDPTANVDDGSCIAGGCLDQAACNYDPNAPCDNGSCEFTVDCAGICGGPFILDDCGNCYDLAQSNADATFDYTGSLQTWVVPDGVTEVTINAMGAQGGNSPGDAAIGGRGAQIEATVQVTPGETLNIVVGGQGDTKPNDNGTNYGGGGGGGSFIWVNGQNSPLLVAGGGGGAHQNTAGGAGQTGQNGGNSSSGYAGGIGGAGGGGSDGCAGAGGGGWNSPGATSGCINGINLEGGGSFDTFFGGQCTNGCNGTGNSGVDGGYGGGGACWHGGGGGGGYSGGGGGNNSSGNGGGGGSFNEGVLLNAVAGAREGNGQVIITYANAPDCVAGCTDPNADNYNPEANFEDGTCLYDSGCTDDTACNYDPDAINDNGLCAYEFDCAGVCGGSAFVNPCGDCEDPNQVNEVVTFEYSGSIETWTVPEDVTSVRIEVFGAQGGGGFNSLDGGLGAYMSGTFSVTPGEQYDILVGQMGGTGGDTDDPHGNENGGGGGSFVVRAADDTPYIIAGGGGGGPAINYGNSCARDLEAANGQITEEGANAECNGTGNGGSDGNGGSRTGSYSGGAGGGFFTDGADGQAHCNTPQGGRSYLNGGAGGAGNTSCYGNSHYGGFGGGGAGELGSPGGGGGYSGGGAAGDWSSFSTYGGGGGSYNIGTDQDNEGGVREGDGLIVITLGEVLTPCIGGCMIPEAYNYNPDADYDDGSCTLLDCPEYDGDVVVEFQKDNYTDFNQPENQDQVTPTCVITRQNAQGLFNIALEGNHNQSSSPANTEWKWGDINSPYPYDNWRDAVYQSPFGGPNSALSQGSNSVMTMHVIDSDLYFEVQFDQWTCCASGGGFQYTRTFLPEESGCEEYLAVVGCMDPLAQNYNMEAELDDSSCIYPGCTDPVADNYDPQANEDDGSCAYNLGCLDQEACNYDDTAEIDDGSCAYEFDCAGVCGGASYIDSCGDCIDANMASGQVTFEYSGQIDTWTVPEGVTAVRIEARGAQGGGNGGRGAIMAGTVDVTPGDVLNILVGQEGETAPNQVGNGGGGGTFVALADNTPLVVAGGGGGTGHNQSNNGYSGIGGAITEAGNAGQYANDNGGGAGGTDGNGGEYSTNGNGGPIGNAGGGGGFFTDGTSFQDANGGQAFVNGGLGGDSTGGFGGGAGSNQFNYGCGSSPMGGGGGGGYSGGGGGGTNCNGAGGGGGSFNAGSDQENQPAANSGDGLVIITYGLEVAQAACTGGCTLPEAYNYDPEADYDDGSCTVLECDEYQGAPVVTFTKADYADFNDPANQDEITPTCIITRQNQQGIYNVAFEQSHNQNLSPLNTTWKWGDFDSPNTWDNWRDAVYQSGIGGPNNAFDIPHTMTMRITDSDLYFEFVFEAWTSNGQGGGFTYTRTFLVEESGCQEVPAVVGCMDSEADNYDPSYNIDDPASCEYLGCTDVSADNYDPAANIDDDSCIYSGCMDQAACNYNPAASNDDGSCIYVVDCAGNCGGNFLVDDCGNCYDPTASTNNFVFNFSGSVQQFVVPAEVAEIRIEVYGAQGGSADGQGGGLGAMIAGNFDVTTGDQFFIYPGQAGENGDGQFSYAGGGGGSFVTDQSGTLLMAAGGGGGSAGDPNNGNIHASVTENGNDGYSPNSPDNYGIGGAGGNGASNNANTCGGNGAGYLTDGEASFCAIDGQMTAGQAFVNGAQGGTSACGAGIAGGYGGGGGGGCHGAGGGGGYSGGGGSYGIGGNGGGGGSYNTANSPAAMAQANTGNGRVVVYLLETPICEPGCTDENADNYNPEATDDDGSCIISGCTNDQADNYNPEANNDDGSCVISGCTNDQADNYNPDANNDDGSCIITGCTDPIADNYNPEANNDDGSCIISGCTDQTADNYNPLANTDDGSCIIGGCTYEDATNFNVDANYDDGSCIFDIAVDIPGCADSNAVNYNSAVTVDDGSCIYVGCTDPVASNYNAMASIDDGSCTILDCFEGEVSVTFTKENNADWTLPENQDRITENIWIARANSQGLFNAFDQDGWPGNAVGGPSNTVWKLGATDEPGDYTTWIEAADSNPNLYCNNDTQWSMHIVGTNLYFDVVWHSWTGGNNGGGFSYTRTLNTELSDCNEVPLVYGCTNSGACNYNADATYDEGDCDFSCVGCTYPDADNYDASATIDSGECIYIDNCPEDLNDDGLVNSSDLLQFLGSFGAPCE